MIPSAIDVLEEKNLNRNDKATFICGVVEGFYGRPWTMEQRRKLFTRMASMGMNTYIYAPKDDSKHRMHWRELYSVDEAEPLTTLIQSARECGITFVYALSPGLDITYSSAKDVSSLKHKLEQVASFGCEAFALLFDDIEVELCDADKSLFQSFAAAQVSVTNEVYQHLRQPSPFFFCPTEYCASRAVPTVNQSKYLDTVGSKLLPDIEIMWTGPKVISRRISASSIEEVARVMRRPPLIWDNIHANDYDPKRLFLGPYDGRSPKLVPYVRGVLTNPNCEFESNFVALHTLAQWSRTSDDSTSQGKKDFILSGGPGSADIRLETEGSNDSCSDDDEDADIPETQINASERYAPRQALRRAVAVWQAEFSTSTAPSGALLQKPPVGLTCPASPALTVPQPIPVVCTGGHAVDQMAILEVADDYIQPVSSITVSSSLQKLSDSESSSATTSSGIDVEPMDCIFTPGSTPVSVASITTSSADPNGVTNSCTYVSNSPDDIDSDDPAVASGDDTVLSSHTPSSSPEIMQIDNELANSAVTIDDIATVVDMFYLPFEYGPRAAKLLSDFFWIKMQAAETIGNAVYSSSDQLFGIDCDDCQSTNNQVECGIQSESWRERAQSFQLRLGRMCETIDRVIEIPNRALAYELFPYLWDMKAILFLLDSFIQWLGKTDGSEC